MDLMASAASAAFLGVVNGILTAAFLILLYVLVRYTYKTVNHAVQRHPARESRTFWEGVVLSALFAGVVTAGAKYVPRLECLFLYDCGVEVSRSDEQKISIFTATFLIFGGAVLAARLDAKRDREAGRAV